MNILKGNLSRTILIITIFGIVIFVWKSVFFLTGNGDPIHKYLFRQQVNRYLKATYPHADFEVESIEYGIKESDYWGVARPRTGPGIEFEVRKNEDGALEDDFLSSTWEFEVKGGCETALRKLFPQSDCFPEIAFTNRGEGNPILHALPFPPYRYDEELVGPGSRFGIYINPASKDLSVAGNRGKLLSLVEALADLHMDLDIILGRTHLTIQQDDFGEILEKKQLIY